MENCEILVFNLKGFWKFLENNSLDITETLKRTNSF